MKWQAIATVTNQINEEAKGYLVRKLEKDASVEMPHLWSDFLSDTTKHLHQSQSNIEVANNSKTGGLTCLTQFDEMHPDFLENNKPCLDYFLSKYDQRTNDYLQRSNNPLTKRLLQAKINDYRISLSQQISHTEAKLIDGKRHHLAIEAIEKLKNATYDNPQLYTNHLQDIIALSSLSLPPLEQDNMFLRAKQDLAYAAGLATLRQSPHSILNPNMMFDWKQDLSLEQRIKLEGQANNLLHHQQLMQQQQLNLLIKSHFDSILEKGQGIDGIDNLVQKSFDPNDPRLLQFKAQETLYKEAFIIRQQLKRGELDQYQQILQQIAPQSGDIDYHQKEQIYHILQQECDRQIKLAKTDPAKYVEQLYIEDIDKDMPLFQRYQLRKQLQQQKGIASYNQKYLMQAEKNDYLRRLQSNDPNKLKETLDTISNIQNSQSFPYQDQGESIGTEIIDEILLDEKKNDGRRLSTLSHLYIDSYLHKREDLANSLLQAISLQGQLFGEFADKDKLAIKQEIGQNPILKDFVQHMLFDKAENTAEVNLIEDGIYHLARFYQHQKHLDPKVATKLAINELVSKSYIKPLVNLHLPASLVDQGEVVKLDETYVNYHLNKLRRDIIKGDIAYDITSSFGQGYSDPQIQQAFVRRIKEALSDGQFRLTEDKKAVYFVYFDEQGTHPLFSSPSTIFTVPLIQLNDPISTMDRLFNPWFETSTK
ncbi:MAG: hypothetical protein PV347_00595 [Rickettsiaceae bacterium]|nr:hypothetical protein [Rickettsiaceae bacterium]MDD9336967.1 hypothetical protein [Rickettsiaceae bacterium]